MYQAALTITVFGQRISNLRRFEELPSHGDKSEPT